MPRTTIETYGLSLLALLLLTPATVRADDAAMRDEGGNPQAMAEHPSIKMVSEIVHMNPATGAVDAHFVFRNDGPATTVLMGFPVTSSGDSAAMPLELGRGTDAIRPDAWQGRRCSRQAG